MQDQTVEYDGADVPQSCAVPSNPTNLGPQSPRPQARASGHVTAEDGPELAPRGQKVQSGQEQPKAITDGANPPGVHTHWVQCALHLRSGLRDQDGWVVASHAEQYCGDSPSGPILPDQG